MTYALFGEIIFPKTADRDQLIIRRFSSVTINSSWKNLTDTAEIELPFKSKAVNIHIDRIEKAIKKGDPVVIRLGYDNDTHEEFRGYVREVELNIPIKVKCEDEMFKLKQDKIGYSVKGAKLKELLQTITKHKYEVVCDDISLGCLRYEKMTAYQILEDLKNQSIYTYFQNGKLYCFNYENSELTPVPIMLERCANSDLKSRQEENWLIKVLSMQRMKNIKYEYGEKGGNVLETKTVGMSESEAKALAKRLYQRAKLGVDGNITLFGVPRIIHGMKVKIDSSIFENRKGVYNIDSVTKTFGTGGYRQELKLGNRTV